MLSPIPTSKSTGIINGRCYSGISVASSAFGTGSLEVPPNTPAMNNAVLTCVHGGAHGSHSPMAMNIEAIAARLSPVESTLSSFSYDSNDPRFRGASPSVMQRAGSHIRRLRPLGSVFPSKSLPDSSPAHTASTSKSNKLRRFLGLKKGRAPSYVKAHGLIDNIARSASAPLPDVLVETSDELEFVRLSRKRTLAMGGRSEKLVVTEIKQGKRAKIGRSMKTLFEKKEKAVMVRV